MPMIRTKDPLGNGITFMEYEGNRFPFFGNINSDEILSNIVDLPCRDDDVVLLTFPKAGTHWIWELTNMVTTDENEASKREKVDTMIEFVTPDILAASPSIRLLNTHLKPDLYPKDLMNRKCKIILVHRNPKDVFVSFYHHTKKIRAYDYDGDWAGFYELVMAGQNDYGSWFDWTKSWEEFFKSHPDIPLLRLNFEDMKMDLPSTVGKVGDFLNVPTDAKTREHVAHQCGFQKMKDGKNLPVEIANIVSKDGTHPGFRKGIVGDWKSHFTVAQNERFDQEYKRQMDGYSFGFEQYMQ